MSDYKGHEIEIRSDGIEGFKSQVFLDGQPLRGVLAVSLTVDANGFNEMTVRLVPEQIRVRMFADVDVTERLP